MQFTTVLATAILAITASAAPTDVESRAAQANVNGNNAGSIFMFGDDSRCRQTFWTGGACGLSTYFKNTPANMPLVAIPGAVFSKYGSAQHNKLCGKVITMTHNGKTQKAIVADQNVGGDNSIDMCLNQWKGFGGKDNDGSIIKGISWSIAA